MGYDQAILQELATGSPRYAAQLDYWSTRKIRIQGFANDCKVTEDAPSSFVKNSTQRLIRNKIDMSDHRIQELAKHNVVFYSEQDECILKYLFCKEVLCKGKERTFGINELPDGIEDFFQNAKRNMRRIDKHIKTAFKGSLNIVSEKFCSNARLLLTIKDAELRKDAMKKRYSLRWLGVISDSPIPFQLEDFWYYEQQTGVNLSVEISALIDKLLDKHKDQVWVSDCRSIVTEILSDCIRDNYCYISCIPAIAWKCSAMKLACEVIIQMAINSFFAIDCLNPYFPEIEIDRAFNLYIQYKYDLLNSREKRIEETVSCIMQKALSDVFNQILSLAIIERLQLNIYSYKFKFSAFLPWMERKINAWIADPNDPESHRKTTEYKQSTHHIIQVISEQSEDRRSKELNQIAKTLQKTCMGIYGDIGSRKDALIFCDIENPFVHKYLEKVTRFIDDNNALISNYKIASQGLSQQISSNSEPNEQFFMIQRAVKQAIEMGESISSESE